MTAYSIWAEGYRATCEHGYATFVGSIHGTDFADAVKNWSDAHPGWMQPYEIRNMEEGKLAIWGCKLFDNEADARRSFG